MKIKDQNYQNEARRLDQAREHLVKTKENDIKNLEKGYDAKMSQLRTTGDENIFDIKEENKRQVLEEIKNNENKLEKYKNDLTKTTEQLSKQKNELAFNYQDQMNSMREAYADNINEKFDQINGMTEDINLRTNDRLKNVATDSKLMIQNEELSANQRLDTLMRDADRKLQTKNSKNEKTLKAEELKHFQNSARVKLEHDKSLSRQMLENNSDLKEKEITHKKILKTKKESYSNQLKSKHESFKQKYSALSEDHQKVLARIQKQFSDEIESMVESHAQKKRSIASKLNDSFYKVKTIEPSISSTPKEYIITLEIPEHERDGVRLSGNDRTLRLNITRNFNDKFEAPDGSLNKSRRSEIYTREFNVDEIVNSTEISQTYQDGKIYFKIPKK